VTAGSSTIERLDTPSGTLVPITGWTPDEEGVPEIVHRYDCETTAGLVRDTITYETYPIDDGLRGRRARSLVFAQAAHGARGRDPVAWGSQF